MSPMQQYTSPNGIVGDWHLVHLGSRAVGGAGLIIAEATAVHPCGRSTKDDTGIWTDEQANAWKPIVDFVHQQGSKIAIQLSHMGSKSSKSTPSEGFKFLDLQNGGWQTVSSSAVAPFPGMTLPKELSIAEIMEIPSMFSNAAVRAVNAGFDTIEIHAAHGYLLHQFYSRLINHRTDEYGGSFENRTRLLIEVVKSVRSVIPNGMPLLVRLSTIDHSEDEKAWKVEDSKQLAGVLKAEEVDFITASAGGFGSLDKSKVFPGYQVPLASQLKTTGIAIGAVGKITEPQQANDIIEQGDADAVLMAKEFLRNPYFGLNAGIEFNYAEDVPKQYIRAY